MGSFFTLFVAALDHRWGWSPPLGFPVFSLGVTALVIGAVMGVWALVANKWFSAVVRLQSDRGQKGGLYGLVRHPSYLGGLLAFPAIALILGSLPALVPAAARIALFAKTAL